MAASSSKTFPLHGALNCEKVRAAEVMSFSPFLLWEEEKKKRKELPHFLHIYKDAPMNQEM